MDSYSDDGESFGYNKTGTIGNTLTIYDARYLSEIYDYFYITITTDSDGIISINNDFSNNAYVSDNNTIVINNSGGIGISIDFIIFLYKQAKIIIPFIVVPPIKYLQQSHQLFE